MNQLVKNFLISILAAGALFLSNSAIVAAAPLTQQQINNNLCSGSNLDFTGRTTFSCNTSTAAITITNIIHNLINVLSVVVGIVAVVMIIVGGLRYITSGGNDTSVTGAKNTILYAVIGLVLVAVAQVIVHFVLSKVSTTTT